MNKKSTLLPILLFASIGLFAQTLVGTLPTNKNAILEEFNGVRCGPCVGGHATVAQILATYPERVFVIGMHPVNSSLTAPYAGSPDLRRAWTNAFYTEPYYSPGLGRSMPSGHINRKVFGTARKLSSGQWSSSAASMLSIPSPVNVGISSQYNDVTQMLNVTVEMYFTSTVVDPSALTVVLTESEIVAEQYNGSVNYIHKHVFREALSSNQWGDAVAGTTNAGDLRTMTFSFLNAGGQYNMNNSKIVAYLSNANDLEVYTGMEVDAKGGFTSAPAVSSSGKDLNVNIYPNPVKDNLLVDISVLKNKNVELSIYDILGNIVHNESALSLTAGANTRSININKIGLGEGLYLVRVSDGKNMITKRIQVSN